MRRGGDDELDGSESLDFERADYSTASLSSTGGFSPEREPAVGPPTCAGCETPIIDCYYTLGPRILCGACHHRFRDAGPEGSMLSRGFGALVLGGIAAAVGAGLWMVVTEVTGYEIGLIAIAVGFLVGTAVRVGSRAIGGVSYQLLAVFLTYTAIVITYVPAIVAEVEGSHAWVIAIPIAYVAPFLMGIENVIGILIIGFALWQAWKLNARTQLELSGPFQLGEAPVG